MPIRNFAILVVLSAGVHPVLAQLYLVAGSPTPKYNMTYSTRLLEVTADSRLRATAEVYNKDQGSEWIAVSNELRVAVVLAKGGARVSVINLDTASVSKQCGWPHQPGDSLVDRWIVDSPVSGPLLVEFLAGDDITKAYLSGMILDAAVPCSKSFRVVDPTEMKDVRAAGSSGPADAGSGDGLAQMGLDRDGNITRWFPGGMAYLGYQVPPQILKGIASSFLVLQVNTKRVLALSATEYNDPKAAKVLVLRKSDNTWRPLPQINGLAWDVRGFGTYLTFAEARVKGAELKESAGRAEWKREGGETGPAIADRFDSSRYAFAGVLHIFDVGTERSYTITTNQGDSEIVLIDDHSAYYRVSDRLYSVPITDAGLGQARLLATSDLVRDAHWAFRKQ